MELHLYPDNWSTIARTIKDEANWICQECGTICRQPGERKDEFWQRLGRIEDKVGRYTLTVAHLNHRPEDCSRANLKALCAPCHCRNDTKQIIRKKYLKRERNGQLTLF